MAAVTQVRYPHSKGRAYFDKKIAGGNLAFRLLEAPLLKSVLAESDAPLAVIISDQFFGEVIRPDIDVDSGAFRRVRMQVKETSADAWIYIGPTNLNEPMTDQCRV